VNIPINREAEGIDLMAVSLVDMVRHGYSGEDVPDDDLLRACVHCGMCLPTCPTYRITGQEASSPRGRLWLMKSVAEGRLDLLDPEFDEQMYQCLNCRACEAVCPSGVQYGPLVEAARAQLEQHRPRPLWQRAGRKLGMDVPFSNIRRFRAMVNLLRVYQRSGLGAVARRTGLLKLMQLETLEAMLPPIAEPPLVSGKESWSPAAAVEEVQLFNGCIMSTVFSNVNRATGRVLEHNHVATAVPAAQQCCGALHIHSGMLDGGRALARQNIDAFTGTDRIIVTAAGCGAALKEYGHLLKDDPDYAERASVFANRVMDVSEFLALAGSRTTYTYGRGHGHLSGALSPRSRPTHHGPAPKAPRASAGSGTRGDAGIVPLLRERRNLQRHPARHG
jgi:glycolate oxidase iron-sulfur subunit